MTSMWLWCHYIYPHPATGSSTSTSQLLHIKDPTNPIEWKVAFLRNSMHSYYRRHIEVLWTTTNRLQMEIIKLKTHIHTIKLITFGIEMKLLIINYILYWRYIVRRNIYFKIITNEKNSIYIFKLLQNIGYSSPYRFS